MKKKNQESNQIKKEKRNGENQMKKKKKYINIRKGIQ